MPTKSSRTLSAKYPRFLKNLPTAENLTTFCTPTNWPRIITKADELANTPCPTLAQIDEVYNCEGLALSLIVAQFRGIHALSGTREPFNENACRMIAELFLAKYGYECTPFSLMAYFAAYISDFKVSYAQFDMQDILTQYGRKFLPRWRDRIRPDEATSSEEVSNDFAGLPLAWMMMGETADEIRDGWLYENGYLTEEIIVKAEADFKRLSGNN